MYESSITLIHDDATYITYWLEFKANNVWQAYFKGDDGKGTKITLSEPINGDDDDDDTTSNGGNKNGDTDTPGFGFISILISIMLILIFVYMRKR